jgi:hypothetical protein
MPRAKREEIDLLFGHMLFGLHTYLRTPTQYFTMLRSPDARIISLYNYLVEIDLYPSMRKEKMSMGDFLYSGLALTADNGMVRFIAGADLAEAPYGECSKALLERAIANLDAYFCVVGLTECFDQSLLLFSKFLGWESPNFYTKTNETKHKLVSEPELTPYDREALQHFNQWDDKLYAYAQQKFQEQWEASNIGNEALTAFQAQNRKYKEQAERERIQRAEMSPANQFKHWIKVRAKNMFT